jgi:uncharacterized membrane protein YfhO
VLLEGSEEPVRGEMASGDGAAVITVYRPNEVRVRVRGASPGCVVLADTYYPGWRVTVDGVDTPVLRANYAMRAVKVGEGTHEVRFRYEPRFLYVGVGVSIATALAIAGLLLRDARMPRRLGASESVPAPGGRS